MMKRFFLLFLLIFSSVASLQAAGLSTEYIEAIRAVGRSAKAGIKKGVADGEIGGNIAVVSTSLLAGTLPRAVGLSLIEELNFVTKEIGSVIFVYDRKQVDYGIKRVFAGAKGGVLLEKEKMAASAKKMGASYFATIEIISRYGKKITVVMTVYDNETKTEVWSDTWAARIVDVYFFNDAGAAVYLDNFYFFGPTYLGGIDISGIAILGIRADVLFSFVDTTKQYGTTTEHKYLTGFGVAPQLELTFSLINSSLPHISVFDIEFFLRGGVFLGAFGFMTLVDDDWIGNDYYNNDEPPIQGDGFQATIDFEVDRDESFCREDEEHAKGSICDEVIKNRKRHNRGYYTFHWRPIFVTGLNFLFAEKFYLFVGGDFGPLMGSFSHKKTVKVKHKPLVTPVVGFGFRMPVY